MTLSTILVQIVISLFVVAIYHWWVSREKRPSPSPAPPPAVLAPPAPAAPKTPPTVETVPPEIVAVIAAAIAVVLGRPHRVVSVQQGSDRSPEVNVWALEGRVEQFMSHKVR